MLRAALRTGVLASYKKLEPRIREGLRERSDMGHVAVTITVGPALRRVIGRRTR